MFPRFTHQERNSLSTFLAEKVQIILFISFLDVLCSTDILFCYWYLSLHTHSHFTDDYGQVY